MKISHITIIGTGLIGGSLGLAIRSRFPEVRITGYDSPEILRVARQHHAIDIAAGSLEDAVQFADLIVLAVPIDILLKLLPRVARHASAHALITDTGSVKKGIVHAAEKLFPNGRFVGGHPMAGTEFSGIHAAHPLLFENAFWILTPTRATDRESVRLLSTFYSQLGARVISVDPASHDAALAMLSHVPQLTAVALTNAAGLRHRVARTHKELGAGGFRDLTRIASSPFGIWKDIVAANGPEIRHALRLLIIELQQYEKMLGRQSSRLSRPFQTAAAIRSQIPRGMKGFLTPLVELTVFVPDKPGMLARLTTAFAKAGINLKDLELLKVREGRGGTFRIAFESERERARAERIVKKLFPEGL